jgi:hypothetical protein
MSSSISANYRNLNSIGYDTLAESNETVAPCISHAVSPNCWEGFAQNYGSPYNPYSDCREFQQSQIDGS